MSVKVLVVDDTALFRRLISDVVTALPEAELVGTASNGKIALQQMQTLRPDLVTLDVDMPQMGGIETLQEIKRLGIQTTVVMLSAHTVRGGALTIKALELGAFDFVPKPEHGSPAENLQTLRDCVAPIVKVLQQQAKVRGREDRFVSAETANVGVPLTFEKNSLQRRAGPPIVLIGVSTGGPNALAQVLPALPPNLGAPVFIVQHMPPLFTQALAERLHSLSAIRVKEGEDGEIAVDNTAYIAPGGKHMKLMPGPNDRILIKLTNDPPENNCRPAADYLFRSAAINFPGRSLAVILTGMGNDGTEGLRMLKRTACRTIAQDEASCVVYGMPRQAVLAGVIDAIVPLTEIAGSIVRGVGARLS